MPLPFDIADVDKHLKQLGKGATRTVYRFSDSLVLKVAKSEMGEAANKIEAKLKHPLLTKVQEVDPDGKWLLAEYVLPYKKGADLNVLRDLKVPFVEFNKSRSWFGPLHEFLARVEHPRMLTEYPKEEFFENSVVKKLQQLGEKGLMLAEFGYADHWGKTRDGRTVILDYGQASAIGGVVAGLRQLIN